MRSQKTFLFFVVISILAIYAQSAELILPEKHVTLISGRHNIDCLAISQRGLYAIEDSNVRQIALAPLSVTPEPLLSPDREFICASSLRDKNLPAIFIYELGWKKENTIALPQFPVSWACDPSSNIIAVATGTGLCEINVLAKKMNPLPFEAKSTILRLAYSPSGKFLQVSTGNQLIILSVDSWKSVCEIPVSQPTGAKCTWINDQKLAVLITGETNSSVEIYSFDENQNVTDSKPKILTTGSPKSIFSFLAISPGGNPLAIGMRATTANDAWSSNNTLIFNKVDFKQLENNKTNPAGLTYSQDFAWAPQNNQFAMVTEQLDLTSSSREWLLNVYAKPEEIQSKKTAKPLFTSKELLQNPCWSKDGSRLYAVTTYNKFITKILSFEIKK